VKKDGHKFSKSYAVFPNFKFHIGAQKKVAPISALDAIKRAGRVLTVDLAIPEARRHRADYTMAILEEKLETAWGIQVTDRDLERAEPW